jgi:hypothetical protein
MLKLTQTEASCTRDRQRTKLHGKSRKKGENRNSIIQFLSNNASIGYRIHSKICEYINQVVFTLLI